MDKLKSKIDKIIGFKLQFNAPAYYLNRLFKDILDWVNKKIIKLEDTIKTLQDNLNNINLNADNIKYKNDNYDTGDNVKTTLDFIIDNMDDDSSVQSDWNETDQTSDAYIKNKPNLSSVATSGSYEDLSNKPSIPTVNDGQLTLKVGDKIKTFTANQSTNEEFEIEVSDLGLGIILTYCGITTSSIVDGSTINPIIIQGNSHLATAGCTVIHGDKEFIWNGSVWQELGYATDLSGCKKIQTPVQNPNANGNSNEFIDSISQNANGEIVVTKKYVQHLNISGDNTIKIDKNNNDVIIGSNNIYSVYGQTNIAQSKESTGLSLSGFVAKSIISSNTVNIFNLYDIPVTKEFSNLSYKLYKDSNNEEYLGLSYFSSSAGYYVFDITIADSKVNSTIIHKVCMMFDTPQADTENSGSFIFVTTLNWDITIVDGNSATEFLAYLKIPNGFNGVITIKPVSYYALSGTYFGVFSNDNGTINRHNIYNNDSTGSTTINSFNSIDQTLVGNRLITPYGKYEIDIIHNFGEQLTFNSAINGYLIDGLLMSKFKKEILSLRQNII